VKKVLVWVDYPVKGNFMGERTMFHPASRSGKGFSALGERWKQDIYTA
jgi:hypothetical protein